MNDTYGIEPSVCPEGALTDQPRAERSAALDADVRNRQALKGRSSLSRPYRAWRLGPSSPRAALRSALGWYVRAPSGQNSRRLRRKRSTP